MKLFLDTADLDQIREVAHWRILDGVTTNPTHVSKTGLSPQELYPEICALCQGPVSLETVSLDAAGIVEEGRHLAKIAENVVVKVPIMKEGLIAVKRLATEGIRTNVTVTFSPLQAMLAAKCGASYISPFVGRLDAAGHYGMDLVRQIKTIYNNYDYPTEIIVAAVRHPIHVVEAAMAGAHICTMNFEVMNQLYDHPLTDLGIEMFLEDWKKVPQEGTSAT
jgi:transaldolase